MDRWSASLPATRAAIRVWPGSPRWASCRNTAVRGLRAALLLECEKRLKASRLRLCVRLDNAGAIRLYEQEGYLRVGTWTKYYNDGGDALVMEKIPSDGEHAG